MVTLAEIVDQPSIRRSLAILVAAPVTILAPVVLPYTMFFGYDGLERKDWRIAAMLPMAVVVVYALMGLWDRLTTTSSMMRSEERRTVRRQLLCGVAASTYYGLVAGPIYSMPVHLSVVALVLSCIGLTLVKATPSVD